MMKAAATRVGGAGIRSRRGPAFGTVGLHSPGPFHCRWRHMFSPRRVQGQGSGTGFGGKVRGQGSGARFQNRVQGQQTKQVSGTGGQDPVNFGSTAGRETGAWPALNPAMSSERWQRCPVYVRTMVIRPKISALQGRTPSLESAHAQSPAHDPVYRPAAGDPCR